MTRYTIAILVAVLIHSLVVLALSFSWQPPELKTFNIPKHVKATLVVVPKASARITEVKTKVNPDLEKQKAAAKAKVEADTKAKAKKEAETKAKLAADKKAKELADAKAAEATKKIAEQKKADELAQEKARKDLEEQEKAEQLAEKNRIEQEKIQSIIDAQEGDLLDSLDEEDSQLEAEAVQASQDAADAATYYQLIERQISLNWSRPASTRNGMTVGMEIHLLPNGELRDVFITQSSGDAATDLSAERAVRKVSRFQVPEDIRLFELYFRRIEFGFRPEDLRQ